jgi:hypothetical protein
VARFVWVFVFAALLVSCAAPVQTPRTEIAITAPGDGNAPVVRRELPGSVAPAANTVPAASAAPGAPAAPSGITVPAGFLYVCVADASGAQRQVGIQFTGKVQQLCERHPEMGPCQYERNVCRQSGGRVFDTAGREITLATEAEYDRKVMRVRFRAN